MESRRRGQAATALGLTAAVALLVAPLLSSSPERALGTTAEPRSVVVTDVVLGVGADEAERRVAWFSPDPAVQCVEYADAAGRTAEVEAYESGAAVADGLTWFHAALPGLEASAAYTYRVGNCAAAWSEPIEFSTPDESPFSFLLLGDPQVFERTSDVDPAAGWAATLDEATAAVPDAAFLVTAGDHVNATDNGRQTPEWELLLRPSHLRHHAVATTIGNHDEADGTGTQYGEHFARPNVDPAGETVAGSGDHWFTHDGTLFLSLNTNSTDFAGHEVFLRRALATNPDARWTIVLLHHAPYSAVTDVDDDVVADVRVNLTPVLGDLGIDLVLAGQTRWS
ncbi:MAG: metallophosphoesterase [Actinomycetota bacterium]